MKRLQAMLRDGVSNPMYWAGLHEGGGKGASAPTPVYSAPKTAPEATEEATLSTAVKPEDEMKKQKKAQAEGAKSLQIPLPSGVSTTSTVGTGTDQ